MGSKGLADVVIVQCSGSLANTQKQTYFHVKHEKVMALSNVQGLICEPGAIMSFTQRAKTVSKHHTAQSLDTTLYT